MQPNIHDKIIPTPRAKKKDPAHHNSNKTKLIPPTITAKPSNKVMQRPQKGNALLYVSVHTPKPAITIMSPNMAYKSGSSHIEDAVKEYAKKLPTQILGVTKHTTTTFGQVHLHHWGVILHL
jgi:hypothetical protein